MLVVIIVIALLAALLLPALARAKRKAQVPQVSAVTQKTNMVTGQTSSPTASPPAVDTDDPKLLLLVVGAGFAIVAWGYKQVVGFLLLRAELALLQVLSDGKARSFGDLSREARAYYRALSWIPGGATDALASLVSKNRVRIRHGKFQINETDHRESDFPKGDATMA